MFTTIKAKIENIDPMIISEVKRAAVGAVSTVLVGVATKAVVYIAVEGTKSLIEAVGEKFNNAE